MNVLELLALGFLALLVVVAIVFFGVLATVGRLIGWFLFLPFQIFGWLFGGIGFLIGLPFLMIGLLVGTIGIGVGLIVLLVPMIPLLLVAGIVALLWRRGHRKATASV